MLSMRMGISGVGCEHGRDLDGKALERSRTSSTLAGFLGVTGIAMPVTLATADSASGSLRRLTRCAAVLVPRTTTTSRIGFANPAGTPSLAHSYAHDAAWFAAGWRDVPSMADVPVVGDVLGMTEACAPEALNGLGATAAHHTYALATNAAAYEAWRDTVHAGKPAARTTAAVAEAVRLSASAAQIAADMSVVRQAAAPTHTYTDQPFARRHARSRGPSPTEPPA